jgi:hypothetical protein
LMSLIKLVCTYPKGKISRPPFKFVLSYPKPEPKLYHRHKVQTHTNIIYELYIIYMRQQSTPFYIS